MSWVRLLYDFFLSNWVKIIKFCIVGGLTAVIYFISAFALIEFLSLNYLYATAIAYLPATTFQFFINKGYTFRSNAASPSVQPYTRSPKMSDTQPIGKTGVAYRRYLALLLVNYVATLGIMYGTVELLSGSPYLGMTIAIPMTMILGFILSKNWVYKD